MKKFCAAPWTEGVIQAKGNVNTCCRNLQALGNWQQNDLKDIWHSPAFQSFRADIINGRYPSEICQECHMAGEERTLSLDLNAQFNDLLSNIKSCVNTSLREFKAFESLFSEKALSRKNERILDNFNKKIRLLSHHKPIGNAPSRGACGSMLENRGQQDFFTALSKMEKIGLIVRDFLAGSLTPQIVMPFRLAALITRCNINCVHCPFQYGKGIITGPDMRPSDVARAFSNSADLIDFFLYGAELFLYNGWKDIVRLLASNGIRLSMSTNGLLLTPENIKYIVDNRLIKNMNISLDGGVRETIQDIRRGLDFDVLINNIDELFRYASRKKYNFNLSFSFVLMKRNYKTFPDVFDLIKDMQRDRKYPFVSVICQALGDQNLRGHAEFVTREHHSLIDREELAGVFKHALTRSRKTRIPAFVFGRRSLRNFIKERCPFPPLRVNVMDLGQ